MNSWERFSQYQADHCWQYHIRLDNRDQDLRDADLTESEAAGRRVGDFEFAYVDKTARQQCAEIKAFIEQHEWVGKLPHRPTHRFTARLKSNGALAGVVIMSVPNTFSKVLGQRTGNLEKLIARGACMSWSPKNLGSWLIMQSIRWMVHHTEFRLFTAYADPEAKELGTIYQACNFIYLGQVPRKDKQYFDPQNPAKGWFSDRDFRKSGMYYIYARNLGLTREEWDQYMGRYSPRWEIVPPELRKAIQEEEEEFRRRCYVRLSKSKHKYLCIAGRTPRETRRLRNEFRELNPELANLPYPKVRGS